MIRTVIVSTFGDGPQLYSGFAVKVVDWSATKPVMTYAPLDTNKSVFSG